ncbi:MAG: hypothetical protein ACI9QD_001232 [Thermoproteota archaeon]|jgi:hypothetical protein
MTSHFRFISLAFTLISSGSIFGFETIRIDYAHEAQKRNVNKVRLILENEYSIPEILIDSFYLKDCETKTTKALIHFCLTTKGELKGLYIDHDFYQRSLRVFNLSLQKDRL